MSSAVLMKCVWPIIMLVSSGNFIRTDSSSIIGSSSAAKCAAIIAQELCDFAGTCRWRTMLDPKRHKSADLFYPGNHDLLRHSWPERNVQPKTFRDSYSIRKEFQYEKIDIDFFRT